MTKPHAKLNEQNKPNRKEKAQGKVLEHAYKDSDRCKLDTEFSNTSWEERFGRRNGKPVQCIEAIYLHMSQLYLMLLHIGP
ncbi:hypothetical protein Bca4012_037214 [Brassica carinata]